MKKLARLRRFLLLSAIALGAQRPASAAAVLTLGPVPTGQPALASDVSAAALLGTVVTATVSLTNTGLPAATAWLYEALEPGATAAQVMPPAGLRVPLPDEDGPITLALTEAFQASPGSETDFIIYLGEQADLSAAAALPDWNARGAAVVDTLREHAARTQAHLLADLDAAGVQATSYWIVNAVRVRGDKALAEWAAAQPEVALVAANALHQLDEAPAELAETEASGTAWGVEKVAAPAAWVDWGVRGSGIVVANIDTGVMVSHTALAHNYRGWNGVSADHNYNWYDAASEPALTVPYDPAGHGTHVMGTMVGGAAGAYTALGVAPGARWIAVRGCQGIVCSDAALISSAQWLLAPTDLNGANPRPDLRPHIVNNSWGKTGADNWYLGYVAAWNASGILSVFAIGNGGSLGYCGSTGSPGQYAAAFSVGATDADDFAGDFSSRGPTADGRVKPDLSAPGIAVPSAWSDGGVRLLRGTSMAAPHVSGAAALLWSANPSLIGNLAATHALLTGSAVPRTSAECGPSPSAVPNNVYGWGRLDARQAVQAARVDVPWLSVPLTATLPANGFGQATLTLDARQVSAPGTYTARLVMLVNNSLTSLPITFQVLPSDQAAVVTGQLVDHWSAGAVYGRVQVGAGPLVATDPGGQFTVTLPFGSYALTASATGYLSATQPLSLTGAASLAFSLMPDRPHLSLTAVQPVSATLAFGERFTGTVTITNDGTQPLSVTASVPSMEWVVDEASAGPNVLYDLGDTSPLPLTDDEIYPQPLELGFSLPIYGQSVSQVYLSSNGWISAQPGATAVPFVSCMASSSLPAGTLAGFWADLDPSLSGTVRAAAVDPETYVVSFEQVPPWQAIPNIAGPTYTFQIVLHASGAVDFVFGAMSDLPARWAVGTYLAEGRAQTLACYKAPVDLSGRRWTLHNQPPVTSWLTTTHPSLSVPPGASAELGVVLKGFGFVPWLSQPNQGHVRLTTNDPAQPVVEVAAQAVLSPAPVTIWYPLWR